MASAALRRSSHRQWALRPQDVVVALKLATMGEAWAGYQDLGRQLHLSQFEVHAAAKRLVAARLAQETDGRVRPIKASLFHFLVYGAPFAFPAVRGEMTIGMPTAHGANPLKERVLFSSENPPVWPHHDGEERGLSLLPLYEKVPLAAREDRLLYEMLALFDALRIGQAREREMAAGMLQERLK